MAMVGTVGDNWIGSKNHLVRIIYSVTAWVHLMWIGARTKYWATT